VERCSRFAGSEDGNWESLELVKGRCLGVFDSEEVTFTWAQKDCRRFPANKLKLFEMGLWEMDGGNGR
jgi:hypothetical protein